MVNLVCIVMLCWQAPSKSRAGDGCVCPPLPFAVSVCASARTPSHKVLINVSCILLHIYYTTRLPSEQCETPLYL